MTPPQVGGLLGDHLESIVRSLLSKLHSVATFTVVQSLLMVLVYLMHTQLEATLSFLEATHPSSASGRPG